MRVSSAGITLRTLFPIALILSCLASPALGEDSVQQDPRQYLSGPDSAYEALRAVLKTPRAAPLRILQYGDSHTRGGVFVKRLRARLMDDPSAPGFSHTHHPLRWDIAVSGSPDWTHWNWRRKRDQGPFGPMGMALESTHTEATINVNLPKNADALGAITMTVLFEVKSPFRPFSVIADEHTLAFVDEARAQELRLPAPVQDDAQDASPTNLGWLTVPVPDKTQQLSLLVEPSEQEEISVRIFGFLIDGDAASGSLDTFAIDGSKVTDSARRGDNAIHAFLQKRNPSLVLTWYGTNSVVLKDFDPIAYGDAYRAHLKRVTAHRADAACIAIGPPDIGRRDRTCFLTSRERRLQARGRKWRRRFRALIKPKRRQRVCEPDALLNRRKQGRYRYPVPEVRTARGWEEYKDQCMPRAPDTLAHMIALQRTIAHENNCLYFDSFQFMGGPGSMVKWACSDSPRLASYDLIHLSSAGYTTLANGLLDAMDAVTEAPSSENSP